MQLLKPDEKMRERIKPVSHTRAKLELGISFELEKQIKRLQDTLSKKNRKNIYKKGNQSMVVFREPHRVVTNK